MFCASCGAPLEAGATFCHRCGAMLGAPVPGDATVVPDTALPPMDVGGALTTAVRRSFQHAGAFLVTQGIFVLLSAALSLGVTVLLLTGVYERMFAATVAGDFDAALAELGPLAAIGGTTLVVTFLLRAIGTALGIAQADAVDAGAPIGLGEAWQRAAPRLGNMMGTLLAAAGAALGCLLLGGLLFFLILPPIAGIVLAVYLLVMWALAMPVALLESRSVTENLRRSATLTKGHRGELFVCLVGVYLIAAIPGGVVGFLLAPDVDPASTEVAMPSMETQLVTGVIGAVCTLAASFVVSNFLTRLYRQRVPRSP